MRTLAITLLIVAVAGCAQGAMQTEEERMDGICHAQHKYAIAQPNINGNYDYKCESFGVRP